MPETSQTVIVARCGLVCSHCGAYKRDRCKGCHSDKPMFASCPVKACANSRQFSTCAECIPFNDLTQCRKLHNYVSRIFGWVFGTNRIGNLCRIREVGLESFKAEKRAIGTK